MNPLRHLVAWSGGADSTLVLLDLLREPTRDNPYINTFSIEHSHLSPEGITAQAACRKRFLKWLPKRDSVRVMAHTIKVNLGDVAVNPYGCGQGLMWLTHLAEFIQRGDEISFGYIQPDYFWKFDAIFVNAFQQCARMLHVEPDEWDIKFPLAYCNKAEVLRRLDKYRVPKHCYITCEEPVKIKSGFKRCGKCTSCRVEKMAKLENKMYPEPKLGIGDEIAEKVVDEEG